MGRDRRSQALAWVRCTAVVLGSWWLLALTARGVWADARQAGSFDALLVALAAALAWLIAAALTCGLLATFVIGMASTLPGAVGHYARGLLPHLPTGSRRIAGAVLGMTLTGVPLAAAASAAPVPRDPSPAIIRSVDGLPQLDRMTSLGWRTVGQADSSGPIGSETTGTPTTDLAAPESTGATDAPSAAGSAASGVQIGVIRAAPPTTDPPQAVPGSAAVRVQPGDSLWSLAASELGSDATTDRVAARWPQWYDANRDLIGSDPNVIHPDQILQVPQDSAVATP
jgi:hypothetical protein